jgi:hypothetical protein
MGSQVYLYDIPQRYAKDLERVNEPIDSRSDEEILETLKHFNPVTADSEKHVWAFWHAGVEAMPGWQQRNVVNWVKMLSGQSWTVRVLDTKEGSPNHVLKYLPAKMFPEAFLNGTMDGPYSGQHSADLYKTAILSQYGGVYIDVGVILIRHLDRLCWDLLSDDNCPYNVAICAMTTTLTVNHFIAARKGDPLIKNW